MPGLLRTAGVRSALAQRWARLRRASGKQRGLGRPAGPVASELPVREPVAEAEPPGAVLPAVAESGLAGQELPVWE